MIKFAINKVLSGQDLLYGEMKEVMQYIMDEKATETQIGALLAGLRVKGESKEEIAASASIMREKSLVVTTKGYAIDTCGTGGDKSNTFNISTVVAIIAASCGVKVIKHGNRSVSSKSGSADVLESLGVNINLLPGAVSKCIESTGIGFMFAPNYHPAMKTVASARKEMGTRTIFNILGPLTNPAKVKGQVIGVYHENLTEKLAYALQLFGLERAMVVHGLDGLDEITITTKTKVSELKDGIITNYYIYPEEFGIKNSTLEELVGGDSKDNSEIIRKILLGEKGAKRDIVLLNTAAALYVGKVAENLYQGIQIAKEAIDSGLAYRKLEEFIEVTIGLSS